MNNHQKQQAQNLYFQTDLTKTQIAELLNISRRSLHYWIRDNNWDRLKKSATVMPALLAENCYHIIAHFTEHLLSERRLMTPITREEADTLHKLTLTVKKLKTQSTLNENMQVFASFMECIKAKSPELVDVIQPHVNDFITAQAGRTRHHVMPESFDDMGFLPIKEENMKESELDLQDIMAWIDDNSNKIPQQTQTDAGNDNNNRRDAMLASPPSDTGTTSSLADTKGNTDEIARITKDTRELIDKHTHEKTAKLEGLKQGLAMEQNNIPVQSPPAPAIEPHKSRAQRRREAREHKKSNPR